MAVPDSMRTSDAERDQVLDRLRDALVEGRLDNDEFDERATATLAARTHGQLRVVTADLPPGPSRPLVALTKSPAAPKPASGAVARRSALLGSISWGWFPIFAVSSVVWLVAGRGPFWPAWLLFWAVFSFRGNNRARRRQRAASQRQQSHERQHSSDHLER